MSTALGLEIRGIKIDQKTSSPLVVLGVPERSCIFLLWVGIFEANGIAMALEKVVPPRPMTHDLLNNTIQALGGAISRVIIRAFQDDVFFATLDIQHDGTTLLVDARPSDAIALALRAPAPLFVESAVLDAIDTFPDTAPGGVN